MNLIRNLVILILLVFGLSNECKAFYITDNQGTVYYGDEIDNKTVYLKILDVKQKNINVPSTVEHVWYDDANNPNTRHEKQYTVVEIGSSGTNVADKIETITLPSTVKTIQNYAFEEFKLLKSISMPNVQYIGKYAFSECHSLASVSMPRVQTIGWLAFYECISLTSVSFHNVEDIDIDAFLGCESIEHIYLDQMTPPDVVEDSFDYENYETAKLIVPKDAIEIYRNTFPWNKFDIIVR